MALLAPYPSTQTCKSLPPFQAISLYETIVKALKVTLSLPSTKLEDPAAITFIASYARDAARRVLESLIWETELKLSHNERRIRKLTLQLTECLASSTSLTAQSHGIDLQTLVSLSVAFARTHPEKIRSIVRAAAQANPQLEQDVIKELVPSFTMLLSTNQISGLYAIRKAAHTLISFVRVSPQDFVRHLSYNKEFMVALAHMYDEGLTNIATSYGGVSAIQTAITADANPASSSDDWERIWLSTKVALVDAFHTILTCMLDDLASSSGRQLTLTSEKAFDIVFALLETRPSSSSQPVPPTPFLNMPLLADYQRTYNLSHALATALRRAEEKDSRLDMLESTLQAFDNQPVGIQTRSKDPGALKLLLRSSGLPQNINYKPVANRTEDRTVPASSSSATSHEKATFPSTRNDTKSEPDDDIKVTQVLDIFPTYSPSYIRQLLDWPAYSGNAEKVIEALLEGTALEESELLAANRSASRVISNDTEDDIARMVKERRNIFDDEILDLSQLRIGKKTDDSQALQGDRLYIEHMKANILRRVQEMELEDAEDEELGIGPASLGKGKGKAVDIIEDGPDELDDLRRVKVIGDGESDDESDGVNDEGEAEQKPPTPETILELAYIRDPKLFDRDAATRRSKARADLKAQTGWGDEQIEGWKIMLERNSKKDKILQRHEFSGNQNWLPPQDSTPMASSSTGGASRGRGRGRGRGGGRGRGRGGRGGPPEGTSGSAAGDRERTVKDRHKASHSNHNRKRGHDKKMAKAAGPPVG